MKKQKSDPSKTVLTIVAGLIILYAVTKWDWTIFSALGIGLAGIFSKYLSSVIDRLWMKLAMLLNFIMSNILLSLIFFLLLFPVALLSRAFGNHDPLRLQNKAGSNFQTRTGEAGKFSFEKPW